MSLATSASLYEERKQGWRMVGGCPSKRFLASFFFISALLEFLFTLSFLSGFAGFELGSSCLSTSCVIPFEKKACRCRLVGVWVFGGWMCWELIRTR